MSPRSPLLWLLGLALAGVVWLVADSRLWSSGVETDPTEHTETDLLAELRGVDDSKADTPGARLQTTGHAGARAAREREDARRMLLDAVAAGVTPSSSAGVTLPFMGRVLDPSGRGAEEVRIFAVGPGGRGHVITTDESGRFTSALPPGRYRLLFRAATGSLISVLHLDGVSSAEVKSYELRETGTLHVAVLRGQEALSGVVVEAKLAERTGVADLPGLQFTATTDTEGIATFTDLVRGPYELLAAIDDGPRLTHNLRVGESTQAKFQVGEALPFRGMVRAREIDGPGVGKTKITLSITPHNGQALAEVSFHTDVDGVFDVMAVRGQLRSIRAEAEGFAPWPANPRDRAVRKLTQAFRRKKPVEADLVLSAGSGAKGRVLDAEGKPVAEVSLQLQPRRRNRGTASAVAVSDASGDVLFADLSPGQYDLAVLTHGVLPLEGQPLRVEIPTTPDIWVPFELRVQATRTLSGRVLAATGEAAVGARVWVLGGGVPLRAGRLGGRRPEVYTNATGGFALTDLPADRGVTLRASMGTLEASPQFVAAATTATAVPVLNIKMILADTGVLTGRVVDLEDGRILPRATVNLVPVSPRNGRTVLRARANESGMYRIERVLGGAYTVQGSMSGYLQHVPVPVDGLVEGSERTLDVRMDPGIVFEGAVWSADRRPIAGVWVSAREERDGRAVGPNRGVRTDGQGAYRITGLRRGNAYRLSAWHRQYRSFLERDITEGRRDFVITLQPKK